MTDETFIDSFSDMDLADPELLPVNTRFLGEINKVDTKAATPGNFMQFTDRNGNARSVPVIALTLKARKKADGQVIEGNFQTLLNLNFWVGPDDVIGRSGLARLATQVLGLKKGDLAGQSLTGAAEQLLGGKVSFEVSHREYTDKNGEPRRGQNPVKVKACTEGELALLM